MRRVGCQIGARDRRRWLYDRAVMSELAMSGGSLVEWGIGPGRRGDCRQQHNCNETNSRLRKYSGAASMPAARGSRLAALAANRARKK
jgi:hypothetical protein